MNLYDIRRRMKLTKNTKKMTQAMELVATVKMRRLYKKLLATRPYGFASFKLISNLSHTVDAKANPFFSTPEIKGQSLKTLIVLITGDRGLCGSFNNNIFRKVLEAKPNNILFDFVTVGRKGQSFCKKMRYNILATFTKKSTSVNAKRVRSIAKIVLDAYTTKQYEQVMIIGTDFISLLKRKTYIKKILPISNLNTVDADRSVIYSFEPDPFSILSSLIIRTIEIQILQAILESNTSEQAARMIAMHEAAKNAENLTSDLLLNYNNLRQELITKSVLEQQTMLAF